MIRNDSIEALKARLDIVDVVGSYIELKKAGSNYKAPCPFHDEKTPSFVVNPSRGNYHCFGCGVHGDSINFVMEYEKLSYPEAIEKLASTYNFSLQYTTQKSPKKSYKVLEAINGYYQKELEFNSEILRYLHTRGIHSASIEKFEIGYAPEGFKSVRFLEQNGFNLSEAVADGVVGMGDDNRAFAIFRERITFPIYNHSAKIVGFGGRTTINHNAKYLNSPQSDIFDKSRLLYGYHIAKEAIFRRGEIIITEGYMDVIMMHQAGFDHTVAVLGTALTEHHLPLLRRGEPKITLAYDGDNAGINAALKSAILLSQRGFDGGVVLLDESSDLADMVVGNRVVELGESLRKPTPFVAFVIDMMLAKYNLTEPREKEQAMNESIGYLKTLTPLIQDEYRLHIASKLSISDSFLKIKNRASDNTVSEHRHLDLWEMRLIKTIFERPQIINTILNYIEPSLLAYHGYEFERVLSGTVDDSRVQSIIMSDEIEVFSTDEKLQSELIAFLNTHYNRELKKIISQRDIEFEKRSFMIRKYRNKIEELKRGNLVTLE